MKTDKKIEHKTSIMTLPFDKPKEKLKACLQIIFKNELRVPFDTEQLLSELMGESNLKDFKTIMLEVEKIRGQYENR